MGKLKPFCKQKMMANMRGENQKQVQEKVARCPKCNESLTKTSTGLWCEYGCYNSEYGVWIALGKPERGKVND